MRFLIAPNYAHPYDQRMVRGLANALSVAGHPAYALPAPLHDHEIVTMCQTLDIDVLMQVNRFRPMDPPLPPTVRHIAWFQDVFPETGANLRGCVQDSDIVYALGDPAVLGLTTELPCHVGSLITGVDEAVLNSKADPVGERIDFSLCGFIPGHITTAPSVKTDMLWYLDTLLAKAPFLGKSRIFWLFRRALFRKRLPVDHVPYAMLNAFRGIVESLYRPLRGELDIHSLSAAMLMTAKLFLKAEPPSVERRKSRRRQGRFGMLLRPYSTSAGSMQIKTHRILGHLIAVATDEPEKLSGTNASIAYFAREYPRLLDRAALITEVLSVARSLKLSLELYGPGWDTHEPFKPYYKGILETQDELLTVYRRTRVNLANNTHGLGLHSRTLECMAVGGFIFTHASPHDTKPGGMHTSFEPGIHYGMFTPENLQEEVRRWIKDGAQRVKIGRCAAGVIRQKHLWRHRALQILEDLQG